MKCGVYMGKIKYYRYNGNLEKEEELTEDNLKHTNGMLLRCILNDNTEVIGYADPYRTHEKESYDGEVHDYINLWNNAFTAPETKPQIQLKKQLLKQAIQ